jgi:hypothetical protein
MYSSVTLVDFHYSVLCPTGYYYLDNFMNINSQKVYLQFYEGLCLKCIIEEIITLQTILDSLTVICLDSLNELFALCVMTHCVNT